ncbi:hypothetical protein GCM10010172_35110 [Paractinoplanes ferrugineus]|uniref:Uncharacterized protein n=1 Tax=Paractinoplanes ferrugineus TaxID=113564 RepID=A0A919JCG4_9ACTN|nr:hypothetical protein [Actinoplanes ferrugineus]GIE16779.1 hypothetical protein Afe05nite_86190 [Actinoplanes ferrugineus]
MNRWPDPVRDPLPAGLLTEQDINDAMDLAGRHLRDPGDPEFDPMVFGLLCAARAALGECAEALRMEAQTLSGKLGFSREFVVGRVSEAVTARRVARKVINELRKWLPEVTYE